MRWPRSARWATAAILVAIAVAGITLWMAYGRTFTLEIPQDSIQRTVDARFPLEKTYLRVATIRYANPIVVLEEGSDRVRVGLDAETAFTINDRKAAGSAVLSGTLAYDREAGAFTLSDARVEALDILGIPDERMGVVRDLATAAVKQYLDRKPVYRLKQADFKQSLAMLVLKDVHVRAGKLVVEMGVGP